jgi:hypothetical protein
MVITVSGKAQAGKDSFAILAKEMLESVGKTVCICHYGDYVKYVCKEYLGWDGVKDEAGRTMLQYEGTDYVRRRVPDFWINVILAFVNVYKERFDYFLVPDTRFPDEIECYNRIPMIWSKCVRVIRTDCENTLTEEQRAHISEIALDNYEFDAVISSESGLDKLRVEVQKFVEELLSNE